MQYEFRASVDLILFFFIFYSLLFENLFDKVKLGKAGCMLSYTTYLIQANHPPVNFDVFVSICWSQIDVDTVTSHLQ